MRTPKQKKAAPKGKGRGGGLKRKNAMKNKMMKKTMLAVGGDDTREDARGLMNDSDLSVCVAKVSVSLYSIYLKNEARNPQQSLNYQFPFFSFAYS